MTKSPKNRNEPVREKDPPSFLAFVRQLRSQEGSVMDFAGTVSGDQSFPDPASWQELRRYLQKIGALDAAFVGGRLAWRGYEAARKKRMQEGVEAPD